MRADTVIDYEIVLMWRQLCRIATLQEKRESMVKKWRQKPRDDDTHSQIAGVDHLRRACSSHCNMNLKIGGRQCHIDHLGTLVHHC